MRVFNRIKEAVSQIYDEFKFTNPIHPKSTLSKKSNISFVDTIREICDNSLDANATKIYVVLDINKIFVIDNGNGMNLQELNEAWIQEHSKKKGEKNSKGCFGVGLKQSVAQLNEKTYNTFSNILSISKNNPNCLGWTEYNPTIINLLNSQGLDGWKNEPAYDLAKVKEITENQIYFKKLYSAYLKANNFNHGTIVGFWNTSIADLESSVEINNTIKEVITHLGECYFDLIQKGNIEIEVNSNTVKPLDPMLRYSNLVQINEWETEHPNNKNASKLKFTIAITPKHKIFKKQEPNLHSDINNENSGIYLKRNGVIISKAIKSLPVTPDIATIYKEIGGNGKRDCLFWNGGNSETSHIRLLIESDSTWDDIIKIDQEKINFSFHPNMNKILAEMMLQLDKANKISKPIKSSTNNKLENQTKNVQLETIEYKEKNETHDINLYDLLETIEDIVTAEQNEIIENQLNLHKSKIDDLEKQTCRIILDSLNDQQKQKIINKLKHDKLENYSAPRWASSNNVIKNKKYVMQN